jgi:hypothetical protein
MGSARPSRLLKFHAAATEGRMPIHVRIIGVESGTLVLGNELIPSCDRIGHGQRFGRLKLDGDDLLWCNGDCICARAGKCRLGSPSQIGSTNRAVGQVQFNVCRASQAQTLGKPQLYVTLFTAHSFDDDVLRCLKVRGKGRWRGIRQNNGWLVILPGRAWDRSLSPCGRPQLGRWAQEWWAACWRVCGRRR